MTARIKNPFTVQTPEEISASDAVSLFVDVFTDFPRLPHRGHTFVHGPRGSGKSMMFRYLQPDCQCLVNECAVADLPFFGVYAPIKNTNLSLTELVRLSQLNLENVLNEHFLTMYLATRIFSSLATLDLPDTKENRAAFGAFYKDCFLVYLRRCGWRGTVVSSDAGTLDEAIKQILDLCEDLYAEVITFLKNLGSDSSQAVSAFTGPLSGYLEFLFPVLRGLGKLPFMPKGPIFLMIDDADNLNRTQTMILNAWVATRTSSVVSLKISTQLNYKTFLTLNGNIISAPHDYTEVNIATIYTSSKDRYQERVKEIVRKRLQLAGIETSPEKFFPPDVEQERKIKAIARKLKADWPAKGRGYRANDDVTRYARPTFIASLKGKKKSGSKYNYAGFEQLVHLSSGLVRCFLEPASQMFARQASQNGSAPVSFISPAIQNDIVRRESDDLLFEEFDKLASDKDQSNTYHTRVKQLSNLVRSVGGTFHQVLISKRAERRIISIALSDEADPEVKEVLKLGVQHGYFHASSIGNKEGTGKTSLYVLTKRLAPSFTLDPFGFAGYLFVTNKYLREAMSNPNVVKKIRDMGVDSYFDDGQLELFNSATI